MENIKHDVGYSTNLYVHSEARESKNMATRVWVTFKSGLVPIHTSHSFHLHPENVYEFTSLWLCTYDFD